MHIEYDKQVLSGTPEEIVDLLWKTMLNPPISREEYMEGVVRRAGHWGQVLHYTDPESFLKELENLGYIRIVRPN